MPVKLLSEAQIAELRAQPLTYPEVGRTRESAPYVAHDGFTFFSRTRMVNERVSFESAAQAVLSWQVQSRSRLTVLASALQVEDDGVVMLRAGLGPVALKIPCRVVYVVDEPDRRGFAYGTLPGHPEAGEEAFVVQRRPDGRVDLTITALSRPAATFAKLGGPLTRYVQRAITSLYLRTLDH